MAALVHSSLAFVLVKSELKTDKERTDLGEDAAEGGIPVVCLLVTPPPPGEPQPHSQQTPVPSES